MRGWRGPSLASKQVAEGMRSRAVDYLARRGASRPVDVAMAAGWRLSTTKQVMEHLVRDGLAVCSEVFRYSLTEAGASLAREVEEAEARRRNMRWRNLK